MRTITFKAGRRVWLMLVDGCEVGTTVPVSQPVDRAVRIAGRQNVPRCCHRCTETDAIGVCRDCS